MPTSVQNAQALLSPGQWLLDSTSSTLYYLPASGQQMTGLDVELPRLETLLQGAGTLANPLHDVTFSGLQFSYATWNDPSTSVGFSDVQSNLRMTLPGGNQGMCNFSTPAGSCPWGSLTQPLANVSFSASNNITIANNLFTNLGGAGLAFMYGSSNNLIQNNEFNAISSTGILMGCTYDPTPINADGSPTNAADAATIKQNCTPNPTAVASDVIGANEIMTGNMITNNLIHNIGIDYPSACGITLLFSRKTSIVNNEIYNVPYTAITAGVIQGHVDNSNHPNESTNINSSNNISNNLLHDYLQKLVDGGAIYIEGHQSWLGTQADGMLAQGNVAMNSPNTDFTFYDDAGSEWITWQGNAAWNATGYADQGGCEPVGHLWITGNYFSKPSGDYSWCSPGPVDLHASGNVSISALSGIPTSIMSNAGRTGSIRINDNHSQIAYVGSWAYDSNRSQYGDYLGDIHYTTVNNDTMTVSFVGTGIQVLGEQYIDQGNVGISIDGGAQQTVSTVPADKQRHANVAIYTSPTLAGGPHTLTVTKLSGTYITMDGVNITP